VGVSDTPGVVTVFDDDSPKAKLIALLVTVSLGATAAYQAGHAQGQLAEASSREARSQQKSEETLAVLREQERARTALLTAATAADQ
jgi:hypothetical protein